MLDVNVIRENPAAVKSAVASKKRDSKLVDKFIRVDENWRAKVTSLNQLKSEQNAISSSLTKSPSADQLTRAKILKERVAILEKEAKELEAKRHDILFQLPNLPLSTVPIGASENENKTIREWGQKPDFDFPPLDYLTIGENLDLIDVKRASKVSGARFGYLKNEAALLEFALVKLVFESLRTAGFEILLPPVLIKKEMMKGMGYVDTKADKEETYFLNKDDLYLIGTAEQAIGPYRAGEILLENELPKRYVGFSPSFRREAGSYGKDTKGILRVHQFDKLEMFSLAKPEESVKEHTLIVSWAEKLMQALELPYRLVEMCTADLGQTAAAKFDIEAWLPGQNEYRETHSISNITDFQARRLNIRYQPAGKESGSPVFLHTLNGTAFAIGRTLIAILENYQNRDGSVRVPTVLQDYVGQKEISKK